jgi:hypothetical protein
MRIWHVPVNYGSLPASTVRLLRQTGLDARGLFFSSVTLRTDDGSTVIYGAPPRQPLAFAFSRTRWISTFLGELHAFRPDIIHWYFGKPALPLAFDLSLVQHMDIPRLVEWQGSDIRSPSVESRDNPWYAQALREGYEYASVESDATSEARQRRFARTGFASVAPLGMLQYVRDEIFTETHVIRQRLLLSEYDPVPPSLSASRPLVVHSSSAPIAKGTPAVLAAVKRLEKDYDFTFKLIQNMPRAEALDWVRRADIFLDQFVLGDFGMAALEAMALGKPVIGFIKPALKAVYPADLPILIAAQDSLADVLSNLLRDPARRHALGLAGRAYMESHYQPASLAAELSNLYQQVIDAHRRGKGSA